MPFLVRTFVKSDGGFHRPSLFENGMAPTTDEYQIHTWSVHPVLLLWLTLISFFPAQARRNPPRPPHLPPLTRPHPRRAQTPRRKIRLPRRLLRPLSPRTRHHPRHRLSLPARAPRPSRNPREMQQQKKKRRERRKRHWRS